MRLVRDMGRGERPTAASSWGIGIRSRGRAEAQIRIRFRPSASSDFSRRDQLHVQTFVELVLSQRRHERLEEDGDDNVDGDHDNQDHVAHEEELHGSRKHEC